MYPAEQLRAARGAQNKTIDDVAQTAGLSSPTVSGVLQGKHDVMIPTLNAVADALGLAMEIRFVQKAKANAEQEEEPATVAG